MGHERELVKGSTQTLILAVLRDRPLHGYAIAREIAERTDDLLRFGEGTLYPALHGLEREGLIAGRWDDTEPGAARKVYSLTERGTTELARRTASWRSFVGSVEKVIGGIPDAQSM